MTQVYQVGGAVRDDMLGLEVQERDWVVIGATPELLEQQGFRQVGKSFPVFLHPESGEEYALARTERKEGHGYHGFTVQFGPEVTLEEDLLRRDLTINAMARDADGQLVDPYGGQADLEARVLRHVSPAFEEDPLRVLRVARFAARFHGLGFTVHPDTLEMMRGIAASGELAHLVPERAWREIEKAMRMPTPSRFLAVMREAHALVEVLPEVEALYGVPQPAQYHPEVDTGVHTELSLDVAAQMEAPGDVVVAVLLHDLGKGLTDPEHLPSHRGHEQAGLPLVEGVCERFAVPGRTRRLALAVCEHHLSCHRLLEARPVTVMKLLERLDAFRRGEVSHFIQACEADYRGRTGFEDRDYPQGPYLQGALSAASAVQAGDLDVPPGPALGEALREARIAAIANYRSEQDGPVTD